MGIAQIAKTVKNPKDLLGLFAGFDTLIGDVTLDLMIEEKPVHSWTITKKTVEKGSPITDHRFKNPVSLTLEGVQFDDEVELSVGSALSLLDGLQTWSDKYDRLMELANSDNLIDVQTPSKLYQGMSIKSFTPNITKEKSTALWFRIELENIRIVTGETSVVDPGLIDALIAEGAPADAKANGKRQAKPANKGTKATETPAPRSESLALKGLKGLGALK